MTATHADAPAGTSARPHRPAQWVVMARMLVAEAVRYLVVATLCTVAVLVLLGLVARWRGWQLIAREDMDMVGFEVVADGDGVTVVTSLFLLVAAAGITAIVIPVVQAARTRVYVATGATRASVAVAQLVTVVVMTAYVLLLSGVVLLVVGGGLDGAQDILRVDGAGGLLTAVVRGAGALLLAMTGAMTVVALFLRWPWWVGAGLLVLVFVVLPAVTAFLLTAVASAVDGLSGRWGWDLSAATVVTMIYWAVLRRVPVR